MERNKRVGESVEKRRIDGRGTGDAGGASETNRFVGRSSAWLVWITETIATSSLQRRRYVFAASNVPELFKNRLDFSKWRGMFFIR